jgi:hypothetical protein
MAVRFADALRPESARLRTGSRLRRERAGTAAVAVAGAAALVASRAVSPARIETGPVVCPFRLVTGLPCPGCGLTRAWVYIAHGDFGAALHANPFGYVTMGAAIAIMVAVAVAVVSGRPIPSMSPIMRSRPILLILACWLLFAAVRIVVIVVIASH